jgi:hypothetical protein
VQTHDDLRQTVGHHLHRTGFVRVRPEVSQAAAPGTRYLIRGDVGHEWGIAHNTKVDDEGVQPAHLNQIAHETKFFALGVQGADDDDRFWHIDLLPGAGKPEQLRRVRAMPRGRTKLTAEDAETAEILVFSAPSALSAVNSKADGLS